MKISFSAAGDSPNSGPAAALIGRLQRRDPTALGEIYDQYGRSTYGLVIRIVRDAGIAEDLVQETFLNVWKSAASFDPLKGALGSWLMTVARNRALDYIRSPKSRRLRSSVNLEDVEDPALFVQIERTVVGTYEKGRLFDAMRNLSIDQRAAIDLAYFEGLSQAEIAAKLERPLGTVKTWTRTALKTLRFALESEPAIRAPRKPEFAHCSRTY